MVRLLIARYVWNTTSDATMSENTMAMSSARTSIIRRVVVAAFEKDSEIYAKAQSQVSRAYKEESHGELQLLEYEVPVEVVAVLLGHAVVQVRAVVVVR